MRPTFEQYHAENPDIYKQFEKFTLMAINKGFQHYGAKAVFEWIRFYTGIFGTGDFKVNNTFTPDYARLFESNHPKYKGIFEKRQRRVKVKSEPQSETIF